MGDVGREWQCVPAMGANFLRCGFGFLSVKIDEHYPGTFGTQRNRYGAANAGTSPGDD